MPLLRFAARDSILWDFPTNLIIFAFVSIGIFVIKRLLSPISRLPGPWLTKLTSLPIILADSNENRTSWIASLHEIYGPIVRLSPTEVSVISNSSVRDIYSGSASVAKSTSSGPSFPKGSYFSVFTHYGAKNAFSTLGNADHAWRRRIVAGSYAMSAVLGREAKTGGIWGRVGALLAMIDNEGGSSTTSAEKTKCIDVWEVVQYYAFDNITAHVFGEGTNALRGDEKSRRIIKSSRESPGDCITYFRLQYPRLHEVVTLLRTFLHKTLGIGSRPSAMSRPRELHSGGNSAMAHVGNDWHGGTEVRDWAWKKLQAIKSDVRAGGSTTTEDPVASRLTLNILNGEKAAGEHMFGDDHGSRVILSTSGGKDQVFYRNEGAGSECMDHLLAGMDTVADTLSYLFRSLSTPNHSNLQKKLRHEVATIFAHKTVTFDQPLSADILTKIMEAPLINAIVYETLRAYPALNTTLPREGPRGGRILDDHLIPEGITVGASPYIINQDRSTFDTLGCHDVQKWLPERWLEVDSETLATMMRKLWSFGSGARGCVGRHLAMTEMKLLLAGLYLKGHTVCDDASKLTVSHHHWTHRISGRDMVFFAGWNGIIGFASDST